MPKTSQPIEDNPLVKLFEEHRIDEFEKKDIDGTMETMGENPHVYHVPAMTGARGRENVRVFYQHHFIGKWPEDMKLQNISTTVDENRVVLEVVASFTHDVEIEALLPGVPPTGKYVEIPLVIVVTFQEGKIHSEHIYWDQASLMVQIGLLNPKGLPVTGREQAQRLLEWSSTMESLKKE